MCVSFPGVKMYVRGGFLREAVAISGTRDLRSRGREKGSPSPVGGRSRLHPARNENQRSENWNRNILIGNVAGLNVGIQHSFTVPYCLVQPLLAFLYDFHLPFRKPPKYLKSLVQVVSMFYWWVIQEWPKASCCPTSTVWLHEVSSHTVEPLSKDIPEI